MTLMVEIKGGDRIILNDVNEFCVAGHKEFRMSPYEDEILGSGTLFEVEREDGRTKDVRKKHHRK